MTHHAIVVGLSREILTRKEKKYLAYYKPVGIILFQRNIANKEQVKELIKSTKNIVGNKLLVLIDQEGGKVNRLNKKIWPVFPSASTFGRMAKNNLAKAKKETFKNYQSIGFELNELGINVNCAPVLDLLYKNASSVIGSRAFSSNPKIVIALAKEACKGLVKTKVLPIIKHIPGHGRAKLDSHLELPEVKVSHRQLAKDFSTFKALKSLPAAMTAHIKYTAIDNNKPATLSKKIIYYIIRKEIGFEGVLFSDDICMKALKGPYYNRARNAILAGCDVILHCDGNIENTIKSTLGAGILKEKVAKKLKL